MDKKAKAKAAAEVEQLIQFRRRVNNGLLERLWHRVLEARETPEEVQGLEDLEDDQEPEEADE